MEHVLARRLERDPRADRPGLGHALVDGDAMALPREEERRRAAGRAGADDTDVERAHAREANRSPSASLREDREAAIAGQEEATSAGDAERARPLREIAVHGP